MSEPIFNRVLVVGLGLIGGSFARALKQQSLCKQVLGVSRSPQTVAKALEIGFIDQGSTDLLGMARDLDKDDLILISAPVLAYEKIFTDLKDAFAKGVVISDAGSVKGEVVAAAERALGKVPATFIPGHPIAGSEKSGVDSGFSHLYQQRKVILTPLPHNPAAQVERVQAIWQAVGADVVLMDVAEHDRILAATSHLPHILAFALVDLLGQTDSSQDVFRFAAGGFRDFTRIAASDPTMWHDISLANKEALLGWIDSYTTHLSGLRDAIANDDSEQLLNSFQRAKDGRDYFASIYDTDAPATNHDE